MNLNDYLKSHNRCEIANLAAQACTKPVYLRQVSQGHRRPSIGLALKLEQFTEGLLTARELRPDLPWPGSSNPPAPTPGAA